MYAKRCLPLARLLRKTLRPPTVLERTKNPNFFLTVFLPMYVVTFIFLRIAASLLLLQIFFKNRANISQHFYLLQVPQNSLDMPFFDQ